jgi:hypothetical protein
MAQRISGVIVRICLAAALLRSIAAGHAEDQLRQQQALIESLSKTDEKGQYRITDIPPGKYKLKAWHECLPSQVQEIVVPESGELKVDFTLGIRDLPTH